MEKKVYGSLKVDRAGNLVEGQNQKTFFVTEVSSHESVMT